MLDRRAADPSLGQVVRSRRPAGSISGFSVGTATATFSPICFFRAHVTLPMIQKCLDRE